MRIGKLNKRITINTVTRTAATDGMGGYTETTVKAKETWARIQPSSNYETLSYGLELGQRMVEITLRYDTMLDQTNTIVFGSRTFRVRSVINKDEFNHELTVLASERTD